MTVPRTENPSCSNCQHFEAADDTCRRSPPQPLSVNPQLPWGWPRVNVVGRRNWCSEWTIAANVTPGRGTE